MKSILLVAFFFLSLGITAQQPANLAPAPPMGWNSWNWFGFKIDEQSMKECMDAIVEKGLLDAGYQYFTVDGGWKGAKLRPDGSITWDTVKFPHGMKYLADYAHSKGLKFGIHIIPGTNDCGTNDPVGAFGHEEVQLKQFVDWGVDFLKIDKCGFANIWDNKVLEASYRKWKNLLSNCGRKITVSMSAYKWEDFAPEVSQMARTTSDIQAKVYHGAYFDNHKGSVMTNAEINNKLADKAVNGFWNDPDMLVVGNHGLTVDEQKTHFALWCIMSAPLILGNDPRNMSADEKAILTNEVAISVDQDPTEQGRRIKTDGTTEIWLKNLAGGKKAVVLLNRDKDKIQNITVNLQDLGFSKKVQAVDIYDGKKAVYAKSILVKNITPHACKFLLLE